MIVRFTWIGLVIAALLVWFFLQREPYVTSTRASPAPEQHAAHPIGDLDEQTQAFDKKDARLQLQPSDSLNIADTIALQVIDRVSGQSVAGADVFSIEWPEHPDAGILLQRGERGALADWLEEHGRRTRTDEHGEARLPRSKEYAGVFAKHAGLWALENYVTSDDLVVLALETERLFEAHVTSQAGIAAAGVNVVLRSIDNWGLQFHSLTDERGVASFRHLRPFLRRDVAEACEVTVTGLIVRRPRLQFDALTDLPARAELVLPPCGSLDVELVGEDRAPIAAKSEFRFVLYEGSTEERAFGSVQCSSPIGRTRVDWVEVGVELEAAGAAVGARHEARVRTHGPSRAGEVVPLRLQIAAPPAAIFRAIDDRDSVLANQALKFVVRDIDGDWDNHSMPWPASDTTTDDAGRFTLPFPNGKVGADFRRTIEVLAARPEDRSNLYFSVEFTEKAPEANVDYGDARFRPARLIVAGHVIDEIGAPVAGAQVRAYAPLGGAQDQERANYADRQLAWIVSDAQGAFESRGILGGERIRVIANVNGPDESASVEVPIGASDLVLTVTRTGSIEGSLLLPEGVLASNVQLDWTGATAQVGQVATITIAAEDAAEPHLARFRFDDVRVGLGALHVHVGSNSIASFSDVLVSAGKGTRDPRLQRIDLRDKLRALRVWIELPDGTPALGGFVRSNPSGTPDLGSIQNDWFIVRGLANCVVTAAAVDLMIATTAARRETIRGVRQSELRVRLLPAYEVSLEFRAPNLPKDLLARIDTPDRDQIQRRESTPIRGGATVQFNPSATGSYRVELVLPEYTGIRNERTLGNWSIVVTDTDSPQTFVLDVDPRGLEDVNH